MNDHVGINHMARAGRMLVDNGFNILPIRPFSKVPGFYDGRIWRNLNGWQAYGTRQPYDKELEVWSSWPSCGVGIACGRIIAIDIDVLNYDAAIRVEREARSRLGDSSALRIGRAPKRMLVYRAEAAFRGFRNTPVDILAAGQQFVAYGTHPNTNAPYEWPENDLASTASDYLPCVDEGMVREFLAATYYMLNGSGRRSSLAEAPDASRVPAELASRPRPTPGSGMEGTYPAVSAAMDWIRNEELDYDSWIRIGMAIKGALGDAGYTLFERWSAQARKNDAARTLRTWRGLTPRSIGAGTLYRLARQRGWRPTPDIRFSPESDEEHPAAAVIAACQNMHIQKRGGGGDDDGTKT